MQVLLFCNSLTCLVTAVVLVVYDIYIIYNLVRLIINDFKHRNTNDKLYESRIDVAMRIYIPLKVICLLGTVMMLVVNFVQ